MTRQKKYGSIYCKVGASTTIPPRRYKILFGLAAYFIGYITLQVLPAWLPHCDCVVGKSSSTLASELWER